MFVRNEARVFSDCYGISFEGRGQRKNADSVMTVFRSMSNQLRFQKDASVLFALTDARLGVLM